MQTLTIELTNEKALALLQNMEELKLIRLIKQPGKRLSLLRKQVKKKMTEAEINAQLKSLREEWQRDI